MVILQGMQQATSTPLSGSPTFAGMLAAFAAPPQKRPIAWNDDDLADDVATLSYERALNAHARYKTPGPSDQIGPEPVGAGSLRIREALFDEVPVDDMVQRVSPPIAPIGPSTIGNRPTSDSKTSNHADFEAQTAVESAPANRNLKTASITIRLSKAECAQLRKRAAEAGLTVSAYLRSCTFEAESLRAMVKDTLAQLRSKSAPENQASLPPVRSGWRQWLGRVWLLARVGYRQGEHSGQQLPQQPGQRPAEA